MKNVTLVLLISLLTASTVLAQTERRRVLFLFDEKARDINRVAEVRAQIDGLGGQVQVVFGIAGIVAVLDERGARRIASVRGVRAVHSEAVAVSGDMQMQATIAAWNQMIRPPARKPVGEPPVGRPDTDVAIPSDVTLDPAEAAEREVQYQQHWAAYRRALAPQLQRSGSGCASNGAGYTETSLYLAGDVAVGVYYQNGSAGGWNSVSAMQTFADVTTAIGVFLDRQPNARLTFVYDNAVNGSTGNPLPPPPDDRQRANDLRNTYCTDWAFLVYVRNGGVWPNAWYFGPSLTMDRTFGSFHEVLAHEVGHIFGAIDAYAPNSPSARVGYLLAPNANACGSACGYFLGGTGECLPDLMAGWHPQFGYNTIVGPWTAYQLGWHTATGDGVPDILRTKPLIGASTVTHTINPTTFAVTFTGTAYDRAVINEWTSGPGVSINRVSRVTYRINNAPWQDASASDGTFDSTTEGFKFTTPPLRSTPLTVEIRAINNMGAMTPAPYQQSLTVSGSNVTNTRPFASLTVTPGGAAVNTPIVASAAGSRDLEPGTLTYSWRWDGGTPSGFGPSATSTQSFNAAGPHTVDVSVLDAGNLVQLASRTFFIDANNTPPRIAFNVSPPTRHFGSSAIYSVTMSIVGSTDAETLFSLLRVQWDVDCDNTWDPPSFQKVKSITLTNANHPHSDRRCIAARVLDPANGSEERRRWVAMTQYNHAPVINSMTLTPSGADFLVTVNASNADGMYDGILEYRIDFENDGIWDTAFTPNPTAIVTAAQSSTFVFEVQDRFLARVTRQACYPLSCS
jgi:hypothetical protein